MITQLEFWKLVFCNNADALEHVHGCGYIHNDLKSNNIGLETRGGRPSPVIIDFGNGVRADRGQTSFGSGSGKPFYEYGSVFPSLHGKVRL